MMNWSLASLPIYTKRPPECLEEMRSCYCRRKLRLGLRASDRFCWIIYQHEHGAEFDFDRRLQFFVWVSKPCVESVQKNVPQTWC